MANDPLKKLNERLGITPGENGILESLPDPLAKLNKSMGLSASPDMNAEVLKRTQELEAAAPGMGEVMLEEAKDVGRTGLSALGYVMDFVQRGNYAMARAAHEMLDEDEKNIFQDALDAFGGGLDEIFSGLGPIQGEKTTFSQVLNEDLNLPKIALSETPIIEHLFTETGEGLFKFEEGGLVDIDTNSVLGLALDIALDPVTYLTAGGSGLAKLGKLKAPSKALLKEAAEALAKKEGIKIATAEARILKGIRVASEAPLTIKGTKQLGNKMDDLSAKVSKYEDDLDALLKKDADLMEEGNAFHRTMEIHDEAAGNLEASLAEAVAARDFASATAAKNLLKKNRAAHKKAEDAFYKNTQKLSDVIDAREATVAARAHLAEPMQRMMEAETELVVKAVVNGELSSMLAGPVRLAGRNIITRRAGVALDAYAGQLVKRFPAPARKVTLRSLNRLGKIGNVFFSVGTDKTTKELWLKQKAILMGAKAQVDEQIAALLGSNAVAHLAKAGSGDLHAKLLVAAETPDGFKNLSKNYKPGSPEAQAIAEAEAVYNRIHREAVQGYRAEMPDPNADPMLNLADSAGMLRRMEGEGQLDLAPRWGEAQNPFTGRVVDEELQALESAAQRLPENLKAQVVPQRVTVFVDGTDDNIALLLERMRHANAGLENVLRKGDAPGSITGNLTRSAVLDLIQEAGVKAVKPVKDFREHMYRLTDAVTSSAADVNIRKALVNTYGQAAVDAAKGHELMDMAPSKDLTAADRSKVARYIQENVALKKATVRADWGTLNNVQRSEALRQLAANENGAMDILRVAWGEELPANNVEALLVMAATKPGVIPTGAGTYQLSRGAQKYTMLGTPDEIRKLLPESVGLKNMIADDGSSFRRLALQEKWGQVSPEGHMDAFPVYTWVPESIFNDYQAMTRGFRENPETKRILGALDKVTNATKTGLTAVGGFPSFQVRNGYSNVALAWTGAHLEALNPAHYARASAVLRATHDPNLLRALVTENLDEIPQAYKRTILKSRKGQEYSIVDIVREMQAHGIKSDPRLLTEFAGKLSRFDYDVGRMMRAAKKPAELGRTLNSVFENISRTELFIVNLKRGMSPADAAREVNKYLFDYRALSHFEQTWLKRLIPFYTFYRKNLPLQMRSLVERPGLMGAQAKLINEDTVDNDLGPRAVFGTQFGERTVVERDGNVYALGSVDLPMNTLKLLDNVLAAWMPIKGSVGVAAGVADKALGTKLFSAAVAGNPTKLGKAQKRRLQEASLELATMLHPAILSLIELGTGTKVFSSRKESQRRMDMLGKALYKATSNDPNARTNIGITKKTFKDGSEHYYFDTMKWKLLLDGLGAQRVLTSIDRLGLGVVEAMDEKEATVLLKLVTGFRASAMSMDEADAEQTDALVEALDDRLIDLGVRGRFENTYKYKGKQADPFGAAE